jgi:hypothetical protein
VDAVRSGVDHKAFVGRVGIYAEVKRGRARFIRQTVDAVSGVTIHPCLRRLCRLREGESGKHYKHCDKADARGNEMLHRCESPGRVGSGRDLLVCRKLLFRLT